eukprot:CAMPEP_0173278242 /NCGR_PEP_ID=MMETSP1143-20121109/4512_1 /TAXON_ID=483371 /ORGANISM="non described non described, Strain CCMP2298" /LENGTH=416 /DNA_ID=CAMNT_0014215393 /DNA_START=101 /DNA_END=1351 /DNA_ORIENTATION=-
MPGFVFEGLTGCSACLALAYMALTALTLRRLLWLHKSSGSGLNTRKLFVLTCLTTALLRVMSFSSMVILDLANRDFNIDPTGSTQSDTDDDQEGNSAFFDKAFLVLFDFPDFTQISAYMLLIVVWAEAFLRSRRHWLSSFRFRKLWMLLYLLFNVLLYLVQTALYSLLFFDGINRRIQLEFIYLTLSTFNLVLPCAWCAAYLYLVIKFSGFPFASEDAKQRLRTLSRLGTLWTLARLSWGVVALTSVVRGWLVSAQTNTLLYTVVLFAIFLCCELLPIAIAIQPGVLDHFHAENVCAGAGAGGGAYTPLGGSHGTINPLCEELLTETVGTGSPRGRGKRLGSPRSGGKNSNNNSTNNNSNNNDSNKGNNRDNANRNSLGYLQDYWTTAPLSAHRGSMASRESSDSDGGNMLTDEAE